MSPIDLDRQRQRHQQVITLAQLQLAYAAATIRQAQSLLERTVTRPQRTWRAGRRRPGGR